MLRLAILADDLTGALDSAEPFAGTGASIAVIPSVEKISALAFETYDVIAVNVDSRALEPQPAARATVQAWRLIAPWQPECLFKKIDSRMKGNIGAELAALLNISGRSSAMIAPAIPAIGRFVSGGAVTGFGIGQPIRFADLAGWRPEWEAPDCANMAAMAEIADLALAGRHSMIAVGASGLAGAMAETLKSGQCDRKNDGRLCSRSGSIMLMVIGSRDPITLDQIAALTRSGTPHVQIIGEQPVPSEKDLAELILLRPPQGGKDPDMIANELATRALKLVKQMRIATVLLSGGDTAAAFVRLAGFDRLTPTGRLAPGMPVATGSAQGTMLTLITKSGGFGTSDALVNAFQSWRNQLALPNETGLSTC